MLQDITKNQHYVPQFYLRLFSRDEDKKSIWVLDKYKELIYSSAIEKVASENYFYDFPKVFESALSQLSGQNQFQLLERALGHDEGTYHTALTSIITRVDDPENFSLSVEEKEVLSYFIACQYTRTRDFRIKMEHFFDTVINEPLEYPSLAHSFMFADGPIDYLVDKIYDCNWLILKNTTSKSLITSDAPVCINLTNSPNKYFECVIPVSPDLILHLCNEQEFATQHQQRVQNVFPNGIYLSELSLLEVGFYNQLQASNADMQIFSSSEENLQPLLQSFMNIAISEQPTCTFHIQHPLTNKNWSFINIKSK